LAISRKLSSRFGDVAPLVLFETEHEEPPVALVCRGDDAGAPALAPTGQRNALLDHTPAKIRVDISGLSRVLTPRFYSVLGP